MTSRLFLVTEKPDGAVALTTYEATNLAGLMVMIDMKNVLIRREFTHDSEPTDPVSVDPHLCTAGWQLDEGTTPGLTLMPGPDLHF